MSEERLNELFSIVNEGYSSIQEREIRDYITNLQQKVEQLEKDNYDLDKENQMLFEENQELKKKYENAVVDYEITTVEKNELKNQQKKFMLWLEDESKEIYRDGGLRQNIFKQILQKYKEITGILDGKENI